VREAGYAIAVGEREADLNAAAAPVFDARGLAAIIGLQGPAARLTHERLAEVAGPVVDAARRASAAMGAG
jgi:DNA-binding IclR family transcriptional regulator